MVLSSPGTAEPRWRNWQTRRSQKPMSARTCGFDSRSRHQDCEFNADLSLSATAGPACLNCFAKGGDNTVDVAVSHFGKHGQRQNPTSCLLGDWKRTTIHPARMGESALQVQRDRVVDTARYARLLEQLPDFITLIALDHEPVVNRFPFC